MVKVGIIGAGGYTGVELIRLLVGHPEVEIKVLSELKGGGQISSIYPSLAGIADTPLLGQNVDRVAEQSDIVFLALPHKSSMKVAPAYLDRGKKVVDLSADYRFRDRAIYERWYQKHLSSELLGEAVYGLPELHREEIRKARLVGNPGCYPTGAILALAPLVKEGIVDSDGIVVDSKSGVTGAGRAPTETTHFVEVHDGFKAYAVASHRHTPEIEVELSALAGHEITLIFTPHLLPVGRGILTTAYAKLKKSISTREVLDSVQAFYEGERFIRVHSEGSLPKTSYVRGSNYVDLGVVVDPRTNMVVAVSALDNLVKGASGQAVQCMNLMMGLPEELGLTQPPLFP